MIKILSNFVFAAALFFAAGSATSAPVEYKFDIEGAHAFVQFKASHLGASWLYGRFNKFDGNFVYDKDNDANNKVSATIDMTSLDSNHAERDVHLKNDKFLNVKKYKTASFESTKYKTVGDKKAELTGNLTLMGVTKEITMDVDVIGHAIAPWEKDQNLQRQGFEGRVTLNAADFGMKEEWVGNVEVILSVEGIGAIK